MARLVTLVWGSVAALFLVHQLFGLLTLARLTRASEPVLEPATLRMLVRLSQMLGIRRPVDLRRSAEIRVPMTWGVARPVILLPDASADWSQERTRVVLRHELADNDIVHVAKYSLWITYEEDRRQDDPTTKLTGSDAPEHTTVLSANELQEMMYNVQRAEAPQRKAMEREAKEARGELRVVKLGLRVAILSALLCFALGSAAGVAARCGPMAGTGSRSSG